MSEPETYPSREALFDAAAQALRDAAHNGLTERGRASLALAGGSTPAPVYRKLAQAPMDWKDVTVLLTDERQVPFGHPESNESMLRDNLFRDHAAKANFVPLQDALVSRYCPFDGVLLGMGEDGHFASLFPGSPVLARGLDLHGDTYVLDVPAGVPAPTQRRFSLTLHALSGSGSVLLVVTGAAKRETLMRARHEQLPVAAMIAALQPRILWAE